MTTLGLQINDRIVCSIRFGLWTSDKGYSKEEQSGQLYWSYGNGTRIGERVEPMLSPPFACAYLFVCIWSELLVLVSIWSDLIV